MTSILALLWGEASPVVAANKNNSPLKQEKPRPILQVDEPPPISSTPLPAPKLLNTLVVVMPQRKRPEGEYEQVRQGLLQQLAALSGQQAPQRNTVEGQYFSLMLEIALKTTQDAEEAFAQAHAQWLASPEIGEPKYPLKKVMPAWKDLYEAAAAYAKGQARDKVPLEVRFAQGLALTFLNKKAEANRAFEAIVTAFPKHPVASDAYAALGDLATEQKDWTAAKNFYRKALRIRGGQLHPWAHYKLGWVAYAVSDWKGVEQNWQLAAKRVQRTVPAFHQQILGQLLSLYASQKEAEDGQKFFSDKLTDRGEFYLPYFLRARVKVGDFAGAQATMKAILRQSATSANNPALHRELIQQLFHAEKFKEMWKEWADYRALYHSGSTWARAQKHANYRSLDQSIQEGILFDAMLLHKRSLTKAAYAPHAKDGYQLFLRLYPKNPRELEIRSLLADIDYHEGNFAEAAKSYEEIATKSPQESQKQFLASRDAVHAHFKNFEPEFLVLLRQQPAFSDPKPISFRAQKYLSACERHLKAFPKDTGLAPSCHYNSAQIYYRSGDYEKAVPALRLVAETYPDHPIGPSAMEQLLPMIEQDKPQLAAVTAALKKIPQYQSGAYQRRIAYAISNAKKAEIAIERDHLKRAQSLEDHIRSNPDDPELPTLYVNLARAYMAAGRSAQATNAFIQVMKEYPESAEAKGSYLELAAYAERHLDFQNAASHFYLYATKYPEEQNATWAMIRACELHVAIDAKGAREVCSNLIESDPESARYFYERMITNAILQKKTADAINLIYDHYLAKLPLNADQKIAAYYRAYRLLKKNPDQARSAADQIESLYRQNEGKLNRHSINSMSEIWFERQMDAFKAFRSRKLRLATPMSYQQSYKDKMDAYQQMLQGFQSIIDHKDPEWTTASYYYVGLANEHLAIIFNAAGKLHKNKKLARTYDAEGRRFSSQAQKFFRSAEAAARRGKIHTPYTLYALTALNRMRSPGYRFDDYILHPDYVGSEVPQNLIAPFKGR